VLSALVGALMLAAPVTPSPAIMPAELAVYSFHTRDGAFDVFATEYRPANERFGRKRLVVTARRDGQTILFDDRRLGADDGFVLNRAPRIVDVSAFGARDIVLDGSTGGNDCCAVARVYYWNARRRNYELAVHTFVSAPHFWMHIERDAGYMPNVFVSTGPGGCYGSMADCWLPIQIWALQSGVFRDVTLAHPYLIAQERALLRRLIRGAPRPYSFTFDNRVIAYAGDAAMLGTFASALAWLLSIGAVHPNETAAFRAEVSRDAARPSSSGSR
jgi:hypothetical protein